MSTVYDPFLSFASTQEKQNNIHHIQLHIRNLSHFLKIIFFLIMCVCMHMCTHVRVYAHVGRVPMEVSRERPIPWSWSCRCELPGCWELTAPPGVSALVCWAISPTPLILFFVAFLLHFAVLIIKSIALHTLGKHSITSLFFSFRQVLGK